MATGGLLFNEAFSLPQPFLGSHDHALVMEWFKVKNTAVSLVLYQEICLLKEGSVSWLESSERAF